MKLSPQERSITFELAAYSGLALATYLCALMAFATEVQWQMNGPIYMLMGVLGYFTLVFLGMVTFLRVEIRGPGGKLRRLTVWEVLGYCAMGVLMSKILPSIESQVGSEPIFTVIAVIVLAAIAVLLFLQNRKGKVLKG